MPKKKKSGKKIRKSSGTPTTFEGNYVPASQSGCHVAHHTAPWIIEASDFDPKDYGLECSEEDCVPDMIVDPETKSLSVINTDHELEKSFFITTSHRALDRQRRTLPTGKTRDNDGREENVVTLVLVVKPRGVIEACYLEVNDAQATGEEPMDLFSDVKSVKAHPDPSAWESSRSYPFPLGGDAPRLCSQGMGGQFTHFYPGTLHAIDLECPVGTPVLSLASGIVREIRQSHAAGGIHARGLFSWNSVTVLQDDGLLAEYVHVLANSVLVGIGDRVEAGQPLCASGDAGFCPSPHLHLQLQEEVGDSAPTVRFALLDGEGRPYFPVAGKWYGPQGELLLSQTLMESSGQEVGLDRGDTCCTCSVGNGRSGSKNDCSDGGAPG